MKKRILLAIMALSMLFLLSGCVCEHEWVEANCLTPKTCSLCEETEGEPLGHDWLAAECTLPERCSRCEETMGEALGHTWVEADCVTPKTCSVCAETEGEALGHTWVDADCVTPKTCSVCAETEGEALGHAWVDADCVTPKTCSVCAETEGEALGHTWVEADCVTPKTCSVCVETEGEALGHTWVEADCVTPKTCSVCAETEGEALGHTWAEATCAAPKTCSACAETEGEALGHTWAEATCAAPKTCSACAETEGEALGHTWVDATCAAPKTCSVCAETEGEALGHTWVEATCAAPKTCPACAETEGDALPHTFGKWSIEDMQMVRSCSECQLVDNTEIDYNTYLSERLSGEWIVTHCLIDGEIFPHRSAIDQKDVAVYLHFQEGNQVQFYSEFLEPSYRECAWAVDEDSLHDDLPGYDIHLTSEYGALVFQYSDDEDMEMLLTNELSSSISCILTRYDDERITQAISEYVWYDVTDANDVWKLKFAEDYTFTGYLDGMEVAGHYLLRDSYETEYASYEVEIVLVYQKDDQLCAEPYCATSFDETFDSFYFLHNYDYSHFADFARSNEDLDVNEICESVQNAAQLLVGNWNSLYEENESGISQGNTNYDLSLLEDGTYTVNEAYGTELGGAVEGTWEIDYIQVGERGGLVISVNLLPAGTNNAFNGFYDEAQELQIQGIVFARMTQEEMEALQLVMEQEREKVVGSWTSLTVTDYSSKEHNSQSTLDYSITLEPAGTFTVNEALAAQLGTGTAGTWDVILAETDEYGEVSLTLEYIFDDGLHFDGNMAYDSLYLFAASGTSTYRFSKSVPDDLDINRVVGSWVSTHVRDDENKVENTEYSISFLGDGTYTVNEALHNMGYCAEGTWHFYDYASSYGYQYLISTQDPTLWKAMYLSDEGILSGWYEAEGEDIEVYFSKE